VALANFMRLSLLKAAHAVVRMGPRTGNPGRLGVPGPKTMGVALTIAFAEFRQIEFFFVAD
jgi:hypothetical protein